MNKFFLKSFLLLSLICIIFSSCNKDKDITPTKGIVKVSLELPINLKDATLKTAKVVLVNQNNIGYDITNFKKVNNLYVGSYKIPVGIYKVFAYGKVTYKSGKNDVTITLKAEKSNVQISEDAASNNIKILFDVTTGKEGFVISEIYFAGSKTPQNKAYFADQYLKITNNSNHVLYADSLLILESAFTNSLPHKYYPDYRNEGFAADAIYMIPGKGRDVPVKPGKSLLIATNAKNSKEINPNSFDLSIADFEFYDVSNVERIKDEDNKNVPNLDKWYCYTNSIFMLFSQGTKAYAIGKSNISKEDFLKNNYYEAKYKNEYNGREMTERAYFLPTAWIIDAVNLDWKNNPHNWNLMPLSLDMGYTYCAEQRGDKKAYGTAVIRRIENGKFIDTNNSTNDFIPHATPSLMK